jgi:hypothetical protein
MNVIVRSLIAVSVIAVMTSVLIIPAQAAKIFNHATSSDSALRTIGFLGVKSFLIGSSDRDEPGFALESMRIISPATIFSAAEGYRPSFLPPELFAPLRSKPMPLPRDIDSLTIDVKGTPVDLSLGLQGALKKDLENHIDHFGVSGLANPITGFASAAYLKSATDDVLKQIDRLERNNDKAPANAGRPFAPLTIVPTEPPTILMFLTGLLFIVLLRGDRLQATCKP